MQATVNTATINQDSPGVNLMPPAVFYTCLICGAVMEFFFPRRFPVFSAPVRMGLGILLGGTGFAFMLAAHETFRRIGTAVPTNQSAYVVVVNGPYRFSRNPMYVGGLAFFLGIGLTAGSLWMMAFFLPLALYLALYVVPREEAYMKRAFGSDFQRYRDNVRRWL